MFILPWMKTNMPSFSFFPNRNTRDDLLFAVRFVPKALTKMFAFSLIGATAGYGSSFVFTKSLNQFAEKNHSAVDLTNSYVANDEKFLHFSRNEHHNRTTPAIEEFIPYYSAIIGAGAGTLFALSQIPETFKEQLAEDRARRALDIV